MTMAIDTAFQAFGTDMDEMGVPWLKKYLLVGVGTFCLWDEGLWVWYNQKFHLDLSVVCAAFTSSNDMKLSMTPLSPSLDLGSLM